MLFPAHYFYPNHIKIQNGRNKYIQNVTDVQLSNGVIQSPDQSEVMKKKDD